MSVQTASASFGWVFALSTLALSASGDRAVQPAPVETPRGTRLEHLVWPDAQRLLAADAVVVVPFGSALRTHGAALRVEIAC
jgi:hypothetical protein